MARTEETLHRDLERLSGAPLLSGRDTACYEVGYRYGTGRALGVVRPATTAQVSALAAYCYHEGVRLVPQGANTGLVGAGTPDAQGTQLVLSTERMRHLEPIDRRDRSITVQAGVRLSEINAAAAAFDMFFPIDLSADPSAGGMVATNTGGTRLLRYGDVRQNLLGLEVVLCNALGEVISDMQGLRKNNIGHDPKHLFVGTGGSFGIVTRAMFELQSVPRQTATALIETPDGNAALELLAALESELPEFLSAFEGMSRNAVQLALRHQPSLRNPFAPDSIPPYMLLVELSSATPASAGIDLHGRMAEVLGEQMAAGVVADARLDCGPLAWSIRHAISDGLKAAGAVIAFDISVPRSRIVQARSDLCALVEQDFPDMLVCDFGHWGDGGMHFNLVMPHDRPALLAQAVSELRSRIYGIVAGYGGSFSAEHGVGPYNLAFYERYVPASTRAIASSLKRELDPRALLGTMNL